MPASQKMQLPAADAEEYLPTPQLSQAWSSLLLYLPGVQSTQDSAPDCFVCSWLLPAPQTIQDSEAGAGEYVPKPHSSQAVSVLEL
jgi:hypothetical protein